MVRSPQALAPSPSLSIIRSQAGMTLFEISGASKEMAILALQSGASKLPVQVKIMA